MASLLDWIDPPTPEITRFYDSEAFKPVKELSEPILVAGDGKSILPADFPNGHYLRNGPNPVFAIGNKLWYHIFDGDGMIHAVQVKDGQVSYHNHQLETKRFKEKTRLGGFDPYFNLGDTLSRYFLLRLFWKSFLTRFGYSTSLHPQEHGPANTAIEHHAGKLFALHEASFPFEFKAEESGKVSSVGFLDYDKKLTHSMTAHPKKDPVTGEMVFFGYDLSKKPHVSVATISKDGQLHSTVHFNQLEEPKMMHDFAITTHYIIIPDFSYVFTPKNAGPNLFTSKPQKPIFEFDTSKPARIGLFRRGKQDEKEVRWFEIKPAIFFHSYNAWEEEDASTGDKHVKFIACRLEDGTMDFNDVEKTRSQLYEWDLNLTTSAVKEGPVMCKWTDSGEIKSAAIDFPVLSEHRVGQKSDIGYFTFSTVNFTREGRGGFALIDFSTKPYPTLTPKYLPNGHYSSELSFVNRKGSKKEGDGYLVFISSSVDADAEFWVLNAKTLGEVYRVKIPEKVPMGFHGHWTPS